MDGGVKHLRWMLFHGVSLNVGPDMSYFDGIVPCGIAEHGFNVTLAIDAMTDRRAEAHDYSLANVFPRLSETGTAADVIALLAQRSA